MSQDKRRERLEALERELRQLQAKIQKDNEKAGPKFGQPRKHCCREHGVTPPARSSHQSPYAPGHPAHTRGGSMYDVLLRILAERGHLVLHPHYFREFATNSTVVGARCLVRKIGVPLTKAQAELFANLGFKEHQQRRTALLSKRAARGDQRAAAVLRDPQISENGHWRGDLNEVLTILSCGEKPKGDEVGKNVGILRKARLLFATPSP